MAIGGDAGYISFMADMVNVDRTIAPDERPVPAGWLESLERSEAQIAAGQTVPLNPVLNLMRESIARMEAKQTEADKI